MNSSHLNKHIEIHTGTKSFECNVCGQKFTVAIFRSTHENTQQREILSLLENILYSEMDPSRSQLGRNDMEARVAERLWTIPVLSQSVTYKIGDRSNSDILHEFSSTTYQNSYK